MIRLRPPNLNLPRRRGEHLACAVKDPGPHAGRADIDADAIPLRVWLVHVSIVSSLKFEFSSCRHPALGPICT